MKKGHTAAQDARDERISSILAPIYRRGFYILAVGIVFDLYTRFNYLAQRDDASSFPVKDPIELAVLFLGCLFVAFAMARKEVFTDSLRVLEARTFSETGLVVKGLLAGLLVAVAAVGGRLYNEVLLFGWSGVTWAGDLAMLVIMFGQFAAIALAVLYVQWRAHRAREDRLERDGESREG